MFKALRRLLLLPVLFLIFLPDLSAEITLKAELSASSLVVGDEIRLQLKIDGTREDIELIFPQVEGLEFRQLAPPSSTSQTTIINGRVESFSGLVYQIGVQARKKGFYRIPPLKVKHPSGVFQSQPLSLRAVDPGQQTSLLLEVEADHKKVFMGEPVMITVKLYFQESIEGYSFRFPLLEKKDELDISLAGDNANKGGTNLTLSGFQIPFEQSETTKRGESYSLYQTRLKVYPKEPGILKVPSSSIKANVQRGTEIRRDFFGRAVRVGKQESIFASSKPLEIEITPLPAKNRPRGFSGAVGAFQVSIAADQRQVKVGDPIELKIIIQGTGRLHRIERPILSDLPEYKANFTVQDNLQPGDLQGESLTFKQIIRPNSEQVDKIPPVTFSYFDPALRRYQTLRSNALDLRVLSTTKVSASDIVTNSGTNQPVRPRVRSKEGIYPNYRFEDALISQEFSPLFFLWFLLPPLSYFLVFYWQTKRRLLSSDQALKRSRTAKLSNYKRLKEAKNKIEQDEFYPALQKALTGYISDRLNLGVGEVTVVDIKKLLESGKIPPDLAGKVTEYLERFDLIRYARSQDSTEERRELLAEITELMKELERKL